MGNESGKSIIILIIITFFIMICAMYVINYANQIVHETEIQDLRTNMLIMQAQTKKGLEEVCFRIVNLDKNKEEDLKTINEIKKEYLKGIMINEASSGVQEAIKNVPEVNFDENCYYLNCEILQEIGIKDIDEDRDGYFIVIYDFLNANIEVVNTKGYNGNYTLTQINNNEKQS